MSWTHNAALKDARERAGLTQLAAAELIGVRERAWGSWERGAHEPTQENLRAIVEKLGVPPQAIGYEPPEGWELVPSAWIKQQNEQIATALREIKATVDRIEREQKRPAARAKRAG